MSKIFSTLLSYAMLAAIMGLIVLLLIFSHYGKSVDDYHQLATYEPPITSRLYAADGKLLAEYASEKRVFVPYETIPPKLIQAFISAEDKKFFSHGGVDFMGITRAVFQNIRNIGRGRRMIGASTITQQVAKNFLLTNEASFERKIKEAILAVRIERAFTKEYIMELYLNQIYLGHYSYGVAAAALNYFNKSLDELTVAEDAFLAALPKGPNNYDPDKRYDEAVARRNWCCPAWRKTAISPKKKPRPPLRNRLRSPNARKAKRRRTANTLPRKSAAIWFQNTVKTFCTKADWRSERPLTPKCRNTRPTRCVRGC